MQDNIDKIYDFFIDNDTIPTKKLNELGFSSAKIKELIDENKLVREKRGAYVLSNTEGLYHYGKRLTSIDYDKSTACFEKCYKLNSEDFSANFQMFLRAVAKGDYQAALKYFDIIFNTERIFYKKDANLYLYLLSFLTDIPEKYRKHIEDLSFYDCQVLSYDKRYANALDNNRFRTSLLENKFFYALNQFNNSLCESRKIPSMIVISNLLNKIVALKKEEINKIKEYQRLKNYEGIVNILSKYDLKQLSKTELYTLKLAKKILEIQNNKLNKGNSNSVSKNVFDAIDNSNYSEALTLQNSFEFNNNGVISLLLQDIIQLIELKEQEINENQQVTLDNIVDMLKSDGMNIENLVSMIKEYLKNTNKFDYEKIVINLIKISLYIGDSEFITPVNVLKQISEDNYKFDFYGFIAEFYKSLEDNNIKVAKLYLDILIDANRVGLSAFDVSYLTEAISKEKDEDNIKPVEDKVIISAKPSTIVSTKPLVTALPVSQGKENSNREQISKQVESNIFLGDFVPLKLIPVIESVLNSKEPQPLPFMNRLERLEVYKIIKRIPGIKGIAVGIEPERQIILNYKAPFEHIDIKTIITEAREAYERKDYKTSLEKNLFLISRISNPNSFLLHRVAMCYFHLSYGKGHANNKKTAALYLQMSQEQSKSEKKPKDFTDFIAFLNGAAFNEDSKIAVKFDEEEFYQSTKNYDLINIEEIKNKILNQGKSLVEVLQEYNLNSEEIFLTKLSLVEALYTCGYTDQANKLFLQVEKTRGKTPKIIAYMNDIKLKRKLNKYQQQEEYNFVKKIGKLF